MTARVDQALARGPEPTLAEQSVARIANLSNLPEAAGGLVAALKYVFKEGSLRSEESLMKERAAVLEAVAATKERPKEASDEMAKLYRVFTHREMIALAEGRKGPGTLPALSDAQRFAVRQGLETITSQSSDRYRTYAWGEAAKRVENGLHPERARSRSRGMGMSM